MKKMLVLLYTSMLFLGAAPAMTIAIALCMIKPAAAIVIVPSRPVFIAPRPSPSPIRPAPKVAPQEPLRAAPIIPVPAPRPSSTSRCDPALDKDCKR